MWPVVAAVLLASTISPVAADTVFFGPSPYLSTADIPEGFYQGDSPIGLENFEDGSLDFGITASNGALAGPGTDTDSVDADDGVIDGSGLNGHSWFYGNGPLGLTFTFPESATAAGMVWTDGGSSSTATFEAFAPGMVSLGTIGPVAIADGSTSGTTGEDHFFGVQNSDGIIAIRFVNTFGGVEVDHVQFGNATVIAVPEPSSLVLLTTGALALVGWRRKRNPAV